MWHVFNDNTCIPTQHDGIDPQADASLDPETFAPTCALTFRVESRGTALFGDVFGWYRTIRTIAKSVSVNVVHILSSASTVGRARRTPRVIHRGALM